MESIYSTHISTESGQKSIEAYCCDITLFDEKIDILTTSAFEGSYVPTPRSVFRALHNIGISVESLACRPFMDLRKTCHTWLSEAVPHPGNIQRIGCIELLSYSRLDLPPESLEQSMINSIRAYFRMLDIAAIYGVPMETVAMPLLGSGDQQINANLLMIPLLNECVSFLKRNSEVKRICFIERSIEKAAFIAKSIQQSHKIALLSQDAAPCISTKPKALAFISYSSADKNIADNLCFKLEQHGIAAWYAPRDVQGPYAKAIVQAIDKCTHFIVILSQNSMTSEHVLNEIDLAFQKLPNNIKFTPLRVDNSLFTPSFKYYLSRQHWMDATIPPLENRLNEFIETFLNTL